MSVVRRSLVTVDGSLYIPTDKASLMHVVERAKTESTPAPVPDIAMANCPIRFARVLIVDEKNANNAEDFGPVGGIHQTH